MKPLKYFKINNIKFNYGLEFQSVHKSDYWKHNVPLIEYCETLGIIIPHYCYHKNLSISGNCRMCLIELKNSPKPVVSCAISAKACLNNGEVFTQSPLVKKARENILEFLILNHPLDCPICDQGGECDLQDQSFFFGISKKRFYNYKRVVTNKNLGPIVKTVMTRCIHCTRCVRFASEVAGVSELGMFGRGNQSEIGTYIKKTFQSELSGNIIDLCPVGALTSKPYSFLSRNWELKTVKSIDFTDGFALNTQVYLKNNKIVKIVSGFNSTTNSINWISDKTRFSFSGMFSPNRISQTYVVSGTKKKSLLQWKFLLNEIINTIYFQDHLNKHFFLMNKIIIIFDNNVSLEVLNLLLLFSKKYSFLKLRKLEGNLKLNDLETEFLTNTKTLDTSNLCLLLGVNTRYEGSHLNLKLRKRYLKGNFEILTLGSVTDLTFPVKYVGNNLKLLKSIVEGNNQLSQLFINAINPIIILSSEIFNRKDSNSIQKLLNFFKKQLRLYLPNWENLNVLNTSINEAGIHYLNKIKQINETDLKTSSGLYFVNTPTNLPLNLKKILDLKLLNFFNLNNALPKFCIEQNSGFSSNTLKKITPTYPLYNYFNLPDTVSFETTSSFINTEGILKKNVKFLPLTRQTKETWQIVRKIFLQSKEIFFIANVKDNFRVNFNTKTFSKYKNFLNFLYFTTVNLNTNQNNFEKINFLKIIKIKSKLKKTSEKLYLTKLKIWIQDFYLGGKDNYSKYSVTLIECSKLFRHEKDNFNYIF